MTQTSTCGCVTSTYHATLRQFPETILLKAGLNRFGSFFWEITDMFGHEFVGPLYTNSSGTSTIDVAVLDKYSLSAYKGPFRLRIMDGNKVTVPMTFVGEVYELVTIQFVDIRDQAGNLHNVIA